MKIITSDTMRSIDHKTISEGHVEGKILMERAGVGAAREVLKFSDLLNSSFSKRYVIVCGKGNNGGDGYVMARYFLDAGKKVKVLSVCEIKDLKGDALFHAKKVSKGLDFELISGEVRFEPGDFIVDCLLGTGLDSDVRDPYKSIIESINSSGCPVAALDIASGLNGNNGKVQGVAVKADITLTIGFPKTGLLQNDGPKYTGRLKCIDIGFPESVANEFANEGEMLCEHELRPFFSRRDHDSHKYKCGNVLVVGGSVNYGGAPFLAASAAARAGAGMVTVAYPDCVTPSGPCSLIKIPLKASKDGHFSKRSALQVRNLVDKKDVIVLGPGMTGAEDELFLIETLMKTELTIIADAGALIHLSQNPDLMNRKGATVLTPHTGELKRLLDGTGLQSASALAKKFEAHVLVKGQFSDLYSPEGCVIKCATGCSTLASAGSGDVLAGLIGAFISWGQEGLFENAAHAVAVHGLTGELSCKGIYGTIADDLVGSIPKVMKSLSPFC